MPVATSTLCLALHAAPAVKVQPLCVKTKALTQVLKVLLRVGVSSAFGVLKVELSSRKYYSE
jgi:hypothetical protein